jgi:hypothetical protein
MKIIFFPYFHAPTSPPDSLCVVVSKHTHTEAEEVKCSKWENIIVVVRRIEKNK